MEERLHLLYSNQVRFARNRPLTLNGWRAWTSLPQIRPECKGARVKNIFVGNLSFSVTEDDLRQLFEQYGTLERVTIVTDRDTGRSRGFGFVEMANGPEADGAISGLDGREWNGRALKVNEALPKGAGGGRPWRWRRIRGRETSGWRWRWRRQTPRAALVGKQSSNLEEGSQACRGSLIS